ncbi:NUDIX domain-containing protein [Streptomyces toyocaensis]|uniref:NUDIX domain-containing protein n=1 Tax=Streptomyces toyocaensis TaxID=55952 RepID=UPI00340EC5CF
MGGGVEAGESYEESGTRELAEELGVRTRPALVFRFRCGFERYLVVRREADRRGR